MTCKLLVYYNQVKKKRIVISKVRILYCLMMYFNEDHGLKDSLRGYYFDFGRGDKVRIFISYV